MTIEYLDGPQAGWFALGVTRVATRKWDWIALMVDVDLFDLKNYQCDFPAKQFVHPEERRPVGRKVSQRWLRIPGKHRNGDIAWKALKRPNSDTALENRASPGHIASARLFGAFVAYVF